MRPLRGSHRSFRPHSKLTTRARQQFERSVARAAGGNKQKRGRVVPSRAREERKQERGAPFFSSSSLPTCDEKLSSLFSFCAEEEGIERANSFFFFFASPPSAPPPFCPLSAPLARVESALLSGRPRALG